MKLQYSLWSLIALMTVAPPVIAVAYWYLNSELAAALTVLFVTTIMADLSWRLEHDKVFCDRLNHFLRRL